LNFLQYNDFFSDGVNVSFVHPVDESSIFVRTFERGVGFTNACGTAMTASALVAATINLVSFGEITERKKLEEHLRFLAYHDSLTQLPNRRYLWEEFSQLVEKAELNGSSIAVLYLDGDAFKSVNDSYGHEIGDEFIRMFGEVLLSSIRKQDFVARVGGDEFVILLTQMPNNHLKRNQVLNTITNRIRVSLKTGFLVKENIFTPTISIGISYFPDHGNTVEDLLEKADSVMYEVKRMGKNQQLIYSE